MSSFQLPKAPISPCWQKHRFSNSSTPYLDIPSFSAWCSGKNKSDFVTKNTFSLSLLLNLIPYSLLTQNLLYFFYLKSRWKVGALFEKVSLAVTSKVVKNLKSWYYYKVHNSADLDYSSVVHNHFLTANSVHSVHFWKIFVMSFKTDFSISLNFQKHVCFTLQDVVGTQYRRVKWYMALLWEA